ncbi:MAG: methyltransferase domain-containing protein [Chloroflexota bacterium]
MTTERKTTDDKMINREITNHDTEMFDAYYYATSCGMPYERTDAWLAFFDMIAEHIIREINPKTVLDAGCAMGFLVETLRNRGVEAYGVDISEHAISQVHESIRPYCWVGSITEPFDRASLASLPKKFDLITCIEVVEHMPPKSVPPTIANLCQQTDDILFSSTPFDYKEATHFAVKPPEEWAHLFGQQEFYRDVDFDASFLTTWAVRFQRSKGPFHRIVRNYERKFWLLWKENQDLRALTLENRHQLATQQQALNEAQTSLQAQAQQQATNQDTLVASLQAQIDTLQREKQSLEALVAGYEGGRFIRFMKWLKEGRSHGAT